VIDGSDVEVYGWTDGDDPTTRSSLSVSTVLSEYGTIVLNSAPSSIYEKITASYYYLPVEIKLDHLKDLTAVLAAYYYAMAEFVLVPKQWMHGAYRYIQDRDYKELYDEYEKKKIRLLGRLHKKEEHEGMSGSNLVIKKLIRKYGQEVQHKKKIETVTDGEREISYEVQTPKKGMFNQILPEDLITDRYGYHVTADYIGTFLPGTDISEGDLLYIDNYWLEVQNVMYRRTGSTVEYIEVLLRKKI